MRKASINCGQCQYQWSKIGVSEERENGAEEVFEYIISKNFPKLVNKP